MYNIYDVDEAIRYARMIFQEINLGSINPDITNSLAYATGILAIKGFINREDIEAILLKAISISEETNNKLALANNYIALIWLYTWIFKLDTENKKCKEAYEKSLLYLEDIKFSLREYAGNCIPLSEITKKFNKSEWLYFSKEAFENGIKVGSPWAVVISSYDLGHYHFMNGEINKALEFYREGWNLGVKTRWIPNNLLINIASELIEIYNQEGKCSEILEMMSEMLDSTFILHGKVRVHPILQKRWNYTVEQICRKLHDTTIDIFHEYKKTLQNYLNKVSNNCDRFFCYGQLALLALIDDQKNELECYCKELARLCPSADVFAERLSDKILSAIQTYKQE